MGNQTNYKLKNSDSAPPPAQDTFHPANFANGAYMARRKSSDASSGGVAKSELAQPSTRRFSGISPSNSKHRRNISEGVNQAGPGSPTRAAEVSTLSTSSTYGNFSDVESFVLSPLEVVADEYELEVINDNQSDILSDTSSVSTVRQSAKEKKELAEASEIKPWLFLGGNDIAKSKEYLKSKGITHILNCASSVCDNYHEDDFQYVRPIELADAAKEEIGNFLFQAIAEIEEVRLNQGKIFVHCQMGVSRSATLVIAYLMWYDDLDEFKGFEAAKKLRSIVSPNFGFMAELNSFRKRLSWRPTQPTLLRIGPHSPTVNTLVVKLVVGADNKQENVVPRVEHLDPKGVYLLHSPDHQTLFLWVGPDCTKAEVDCYGSQKSKNKYKETYEDAGRRLGKMMSKYEKAFSSQGRPCIFVQVDCDSSASTTLSEGADQNTFGSKFWRCLGETTGSTFGVEKLRSNHSDKKWTEEQTRFIYNPTIVPGPDETKGKVEKAPSPVKSTSLAKEDSVKGQTLLRSSSRSLSVALPSFPAVLSSSSSRRLSVDAKAADDTKSKKLEPLSATASFRQSSQPTIPPPELALETVKSLTETKS